ncbi:MAG TPA: GNAT family N-acetyltransferase, partial [Acetobacteraceae bacterium]|nr:GNAT family N-acetyltransferase [Acetobacteraceae bacterium]
IGAGSTAGRQVLANLEAGGFRGSVAALDDAVGLEPLAAAPDLAVVAADPSPELLRLLAVRGTFAAIVVCDAAGLADPGPRAGVRILGPGSFGICVPAIGLNASRAHIVPPAGTIALVSQSASLCRTVLDWAGPNGVGFSHIVGLGGRADLGFGMVLDWLSRDRGTGAILLDIRTLGNRRKFLSAARAASRLRPVVAIRAGSILADPSGEAARAFEAALRRAGVLCVSKLEDLLAAAETLARARPARSETISIVTNGITPGRLAADAALRAGLQLAGDIVHVEPDQSARLADLAETAGASADIGGVLVVHAPTGQADHHTMAKLTARRGEMRVPMLVCAMGETAGAANRRQMAEAGMAVFATPEQAIGGFLHLVQDRRNRAAARELPDGAALTIGPDHDAVRGVCAAIRSAGRLTATQDEALAVLNAYGVPVVPTRPVATPDDAADAARLLGFPAVVKLRENARPDQRASGGLVLDLQDPGEVVQAAWRISPRQHAGEPPLLVQRQPVLGRELRIRIAEDATFGPIISFGQGGTTADILGDIATDLPPLNLALAHGLIRRTRAAATLEQGERGRMRSPFSSPLSFRAIQTSGDPAFGHHALGPFRDNPPANEPAVAEALVRVSQLIVDFPEIAELDLNPLIADPEGVVAVDAWLRLREPGDTGGGLAITPYPAELTEHWMTLDGERLLFRPIRPEDADEHGAFFNRLSPQDVRFRFFTAIRELSPEQVARLTQIDYDREIAFLAVRESTGETVGVARLVCENEGEGEFAVIVQPDMKGKGIARHLMHRLIDWGRARGLGEMVGQVLADNAPMLALVRRLGFRLQRAPEEPDVVEARLSLR